MVRDTHRPDGNGWALLPALRAWRPYAAREMTYEDRLKVNYDDPAMTLDEMKLDE